MNNLNSLIIEGKATFISSNDDGFKCTVLNLEVERKISKTETEISNFEIHTLGNMAKTAEEKTRKEPRNIRIVGRLKQMRWTDETGRNHSKLVVIAEHIEFKKEEEKKAE